jgi:hypothetical protein
MIWNSSKKYKEITKWSRRKSYIICKDFNVSHMKHVGGIHANEKIDHYDTRSHRSTNYPIMAWDFGQKH